MPRPFVLRSSLSFEALLLPLPCLAIIRRHAHYNMYHNGKGPYNPCQKFAFLLLFHSTSSLFLLFVSHFVRFAHLSEGSLIFKAALHASRIDYQNIRTICSFHNHILLTQIRRNMLCVCVCPLLCSNYRSGFGILVYCFA